MLAAAVAIQLQEDALVTYKRLAEKSGLDERIAIFLVNIMGCRTLEDLGNVTELQVDEKIVPAIANLDTPVVMSSRLKKLIKTVQGTSKVSLVYEHAEETQSEDTPLPSEEMKRLETLFFDRYKLRIPAEEDADESVVSRLRHHLNKHRITFEDILKTKTKRGESAECRIERAWHDLFMELGNKTDPGEPEDPERKVGTIAVEDYLSALWTYILGLARAGVEKVQGRPDADETNDSQTYDYVQIPLDVLFNYHSRAKRFAASLPKRRAFAILKSTDEAERLLWSERARGPKVGMIIHEIMMERAHAWVWHGEAWVMQPTTSPGPATALGAPRHADVTPKEVGTWATELKDSRTLCQAYQRQQCTDNPCPRGAHACAVVLRASGFTCGLKHPACLHNKDARRAARQAKRAKKVKHLQLRHIVATSQQASRGSKHQGNVRSSSQAVQACILALQRGHLPNQCPLWEHHQ